MKQKRIRSKKKLRTLTRMAKAATTFGRGKQTLAKAHLAGGEKTQTTEVQIHLGNPDVANFLKDLKDFNSRSKKTRIIAK